MLSVIVPTYREVDNIENLVNLVGDVLLAAVPDYELLIVDDDSGDGTEERVAELSGSFPVRCLVRKGVVRDLSESVLDGLEEARGDICVVMDADLSHPPQAIPEMVRLLESGQADFVIGSRYVPGGSFDREWDFWRYLNSKVATILVGPLAKCTDPMSGFFALRKSDLPAREGLHPLGYKIGLELMIRGEFTGIREVPIRFRDREKGESKMNFRQQLNFLLHLRRLYLYRFPNPTELLHFLFIGASGFVIDISVYLVLQLTGLDHRIARAISFWPAVTSNWFLNRNTTFSERSKRPSLKQWFEFVTTSLVGFAISWGSYTLLTTFFGFFDDWRLLALLIGTGFGSTFNFIAASLFVYNEKRQ